MGADRKWCISAAMACRAAAARYTFGSDTTRTWRVLIYPVPNVTSPVVEKRGGGFNMVSSR